jgi:hypothetical protein
MVETLRDCGRLQAARRKLKVQSTLQIPRCRSLRISAMVFNQPKHFSILFLFLRLMAWSACRVVCASMAFPPPAYGFAHVR